MSIPDIDSAAATPTPNPTPIDFHMKDPAFVGDPYPVFAKWRNTAPYVHFVGEPFNGWFVFRDADVRRVCDEGDTFSADVHGDGDRSGLFQIDEPNHGKILRLIATAWRDAAPDVTTLIDHSIKDTLNRLDGKGFDLVEDFARRIPRNVYYDILGGAGLDATTRDRLDTLARTVMKHYDQTLTAAQKEIGKKAGDELGAMLLSLLQSPAEPAFEGSFLARLAPHVSDTTGNPLTTPVAVRSLVSMTVAGYMSVEFLLATSVRRLLLDDAAWWKQVQAGTTGLPGFLDEARRCEHALSVIDRIATRDVTVGEVTIRKGQRVYGVLASANRDEALYGKDADVFDPARTLKQAHLGFGHGVHECMGIQLQKLIAEPAIEALMAAKPGLRLATYERPPWFENFYFRSFDHLEVAP